VLFSIVVKYCDVFVSVCTVLAATSFIMQSVYIDLQAWSSIVYQLIPNVQQMEKSLSDFGQILDADEVLLFERATFLVSVLSASCSLCFVNFIAIFILTEKQQFRSKLQIRCEFSYHQWFFSNRIILVDTT
jgi:predicted PurR-regulated permease PerM